MGKPICERLGAAVDFIIEDEDMIEVAIWITENLKFDRIYLYGRRKPIHISNSSDQAMQITFMVPAQNGKLIPRTCQAEKIAEIACKLSSF
jgi:hypothetical protein